MTAREVLFIFFSVLQNYCPIFLRALNHVINRIEKL